MVKYSVLDQSIAIAGLPHAASIQDTIELAQLIEKLGYFRFWVSEHHNHGTILGTAPEILMAAIAQTTKKIRIGSAGVMLPHYSPYKIAEQFRVLDAIAPGRIDLGLGRAPGSDSKTSMALNPNGRFNTENFPSNVRDLIAWVSNKPLIDTHPYKSLKAYPLGNTMPDLWMLGSSDYGAQLAAHFGIPYCFAHFITDGSGLSRAAHLYRDSYQPSERYPEPLLSACVWALAAENEEKAKYLFKPRAHWKLMRNRGILAPLISPINAQKYTYSNTDEAFMDDLYRHSLVGTPAYLKERLNSLIKDSTLDEVVLLTWSYDKQDRLHSYKLLAKTLL
ncbi:MAG: LLM class flavin-dependent oxidoreductase [Magnetovibrio sp.]|nr:LLM class flavin-dependent oxidoreductase [Magnetovibrio sp.]|tara:strand:+ start:221 stop:1222 length:1002 start_codon:yes stop_codon:yes gene_type:complete